MLSMKEVKRKTTRKKSVQVQIDSVDSEPNDEKSNLTKQRVHSHFSPLVALFAVMAIAVGGIIFYIAFSKTNITVTVVPETDDFVFSYATDEVDAQVVSKELEDSFTFSDFTKSEEEVSGTATGTVTIYNTYSADQPLVRTTRLLSETGVLFRTDQTVTVPSGGSIDVKVNADEAGATGDIEPTKFEIVALWDGLKDQIYAESTEAMSGGIVKSGVVTQEAIDQARKKAEQQLRKTASKELADDPNITNAISAEDMIIDIIDQTVDAEVGEPANEIVVDTNTTVSGYAFDKRKLTDLLIKDTGIEISGKGIEYEISDDAGQAYIKGTIQVPAQGTVMEGIEVEQLTNKSAEQIRRYLESFDEVKDVVITFSPFWIKTSSPSAKNIQVNVVQ